MGMENFGSNNNKEVVPAATAENAEKKEVGMENVEAQIEVEAQKLEQGVTELKASLESIGGEAGLEEKINSLDESRLKEIQGYIKDSIRDICADGAALISNMLLVGGMASIVVYNLQAMYEYIQQAGISGHIEVSPTYAIGAGVAGAVTGALLFPERIGGLITGSRDLIKSLSEKKQIKEQTV